MEKIISRIKNACHLKLWFDYTHTYSTECHLKRSSIKSSLKFIRESACLWNVQISLTNSFAELLGNRFWIVLPYASLNTTWRCKIVQKPPFACHSCQFLWFNITHLFIECFLTAAVSLIFSDQNERSANIELSAEHLCFYIKIRDSDTEKGWKWHFGG